jgi:tRNA threonylcarbamoyladenosine biosynthesis protein TsaB
MNVSDTGQRLLLIDTCGKTEGVALCLGGEMMANEEFAAGEASAKIVGAVRRMLEQVGWRLSELDAVGVVGGPGSFTGVRTGLSVAKGLCVSCDLRLAVVSRLEVLAQAAGVEEGLVALDAGRGEFYVRDVRSGGEMIAGMDAMMQGVVLAEAQTVEKLAAFTPRLHPLHVGDALGAVLACLRAGGSDAALAEANYVRGGREIYPSVAVRGVV